MTLVDEAIAEMYDVFSSYRRPKWFNACACCWSGDRLDDAEAIGRVQVRVLPPGGARSVRELTAAELQQFAEHVPVTCGDSDVLRHYLPRLIEIAIGEGFDWPEMEIVFARMSLTVLEGAIPWTEWPAVEVAAVRKLLRACFRELLPAADWQVGADQLWCSIYLTDPDIEWYLEEWLMFERPEMATALHRFVESSAGYWPQGELSNAYSSSTSLGPINQVKLIAWLTNPSTAEAVRHAVARSNDAVEIAALESCLSLLTH
jgi:hypothetical protein